MPLQLSKNEGTDTGVGLECMKSRLGRSRTSGRRCWRPGVTDDSGPWARVEADEARRENALVSTKDELPALDGFAAIGDQPSLWPARMIERVLESTHEGAEARQAHRLGIQFVSAGPLHEDADFAPFVRPSQRLFINTDRVAKPMSPRAQLIAPATPRFGHQNTSPISTPIRSSNAAVPPHHSSPRPRTPRREPEAPGRVAQGAPSWSGGRVSSIRHRDARLSNRSPSPRSIGTQPPLEQ